MSTAGASGGSPLDVPFRFFFLTSLIALPWLNPVASGPSPAVVPWLFSIICACLAMPLIFKSRTDVAVPSARAWLAAGLLSSGIGLIQYFGGAQALYPLVDATSVGEAFANLRQRNQFATLTNIGLVSLVYFVSIMRPKLPHEPNLDGGRSPFRPAPGPALVLAAAALVAAGNAASSSRTGLLQLIAVFSISIWWGWARHRSVRQLLIVAGLTYCIAAFALPRIASLDPLSAGILARLRGGEPACASRLTLWSNVVHLVHLKPWLGWGWGNLDFAHFMTLYEGPRFCDILDNAHNLPLHLAVELGMPVAALACGFGIWLVVRSRPWRELNPSRQMAWAVMSLILLHSMLEYPLWYGPFQIAAVLCVWILCSSKPERHEPLQLAPSAPPIEAHAPSFPVQLIASCISALVLCGVAYAAWDYHRISQIYLPPNARSSAYREDTLEKIRPSWLFRNQVKFAELTTTDVTATNAAHVNALAKEMLHFSPEARVAEKLIESAVVLERDDEALYYLARYRAAFPNEHARWAATMRLPAEPSASAN